MEKPFQNKITWTIKKFSSFQYNTIYSEYFIIGGCKWRLQAYPKGYNDDNHLSLYVFVDDSALFPCGWRINIKYRLTVVNQFQEELSQVEESQSSWFDQKIYGRGRQKMLPHTKLHDKDGGFLMNDEVKVIAEIEILEVIGKSDVSIEETTQVIYVNGLFERHLDTATNVNNQYDKKITWTIKNFSSLKSVALYSDHFVVGGCKWRLRVYPKGYNNNNSYLSLYLEVPDSELLHSEWRRHAQYRLTVVNQLQEERSHVEEFEPRLFHQKSPIRGYPEMLPLTKLHSKDGGFLVNNEVKITVEVDVLEVIGKSDILEEKTTPVNVNGFQVLPSQVKSVNRLFERHPNIATNVKNQYLKTGFMNVLLNLTDTFRKLPEKFSKNDLIDAYDALQYMTHAGFELDWLKNKLAQVEENIHKEEEDEFWRQDIEEKLNEWKQRCSDLEALLEMNKAEVLATRVPHTLADDF